MRQERERERERGGGKIGRRRFWDSRRAVGCENFERFGGIRELQRDARVKAKLYIVAGEMKLCVLNIVIFSSVGYT